MKVIINDYVVFSGSLSDCIDYIKGLDNKVSGFNRIEICEVIKTVTIETKMIVS